MQQSATLNIRGVSKSLLLPWLIWGMSSLFVTYQMLLQTAPSVMITDLSQAFSLNEFGVSLLSSSFFYTYVLFQIPSGMLIDRVQPRYCLTFCFLAIAATTLVMAQADTLAVAKISRIIQGAFSALSVVPALYLAANWFSPARFALLAGLTEMVGMSGAALGQAGLAPCMGYMGWRSTLVMCAVMGVVLAVLTWMIVRNKPVDETEDAEVPSANVVPSSLLQQLVTVIGFRQAWINGLYAGLLFAIAAAFGGFWCIPYLMNVYHFSLNTAALASSMTLFGSALGAPIIGWASDRMGLRKIPMIASAAIVLVFMVMILTITHLSFVAVIALLFAIGFFSSSYALPFAVMRDIMPARVRGTAMGYTNMMCILIGSPILQPLIGGIMSRQIQQGVDKALAYQHAMWVLPICLGIGLVLAFFIQETYCGRRCS